MKKLFIFLLSLSLVTSCTKQEETHVAVAPPHLEQRGNVTQLIVDDAPWLVLGCELGNSTSSSR